jgi:hypothetical protein
MGNTYVKFAVSVCCLLHVYATKRIVFPKERILKFSVIKLSNALILSVGIFDQFFNITVSYSPII